MRPLAPEDVLAAAAEAELLVLPDRRILVRHRGGASVIGGIDAEELAAVLAAVDGRRSADAVCAAVAGEVGAPAARRILRRLLGDVLLRPAEVEEPEPPRPALPVPALDPVPTPTAGRVVVVANGPAGGWAAGILGEAGIADLTVVEVEAFAACRDAAFLAGEEARIEVPHPRPQPAAGRVAPREEDATVRGRGAGGARRERLALADAAVLAARLRGAGLAVVLLEEVPYRALFAVQAAALAAGVPALAATADPDGTRLGPTALPGDTPCLACAQLAALAWLGLPPGPLLGAASHLRVGRLGAGTLAAIGGALVDETRRALGGRPRRGEEVLLWSTGGPRRLAVARRPGCPLCSEIAGAEVGAGHQGPRARDTTASRAPARETASPPPLPRSVGIVGGGTAGYLAALALRRRYPGIAVTLIESSRLGVIGVGEATTPLMPQFLHADLGLDVAELFAEVRPTLKLGIRFLWGPPGGDFPFPFGPLHAHEALAYDGDLGACSPAALYMAAGSVPVDNGAGPPASRLGTELAYHLDNRRFVAYLVRQAERRGVERVEGVVSGVELAADGERIAALRTEEGRRLAFDLYLDCSGFRSLLVGEALGSPFLDFARSLPTDRALVAEVPHGGCVAPYTLAETMSAGWCWATPQEEADHRGYVYASSHLSDDAAEAEMRRANPGMGEARVIRFRAGRRAHFWRGNAVALGNAYGFVEPLESTALHMLIRQIGLLLQTLPEGPGQRARRQLADRRVAEWWDYLGWFLALHYRFNRRLDTPFWRQCQEEVDVSRHAELLALFHERGTVARDPAAAAAVAYPDPLWGPVGIDLLLLGQGVASERRPTPRLSAAAWVERVRPARAAAARSLPQEQALPLLRRHPELLEPLAAAFRAVGPAFPP